MVKVPVPRSCSHYVILCCVLCYCVMCCVMLCPSYVTFVVVLFLFYVIYYFFRPLIWSSVCKQYSQPMRGNHGCLAQRHYLEHNLWMTHEVCRVPCEFIGIDYLVKSLMPTAQTLVCLVTNSVKCCTLSVSLSPRQPRWAPQFCIYYCQKICCWWVQEAFYKLCQILWVNFEMWVLHFRHKFSNLI